MLLSLSRTPVTVTTSGLTMNVEVMCVVNVCVTDMAVGCPYGGEDQQGLVLIYNGL